MKKYFFIIFIFSLLPISFVFADITNTGFIPNTIWYSSLPLVEGSSVKVYTVVWNSDSNPLSAKVEFYDQNVILGSRDIVVPAQSLKDVSVTWKVTSGDHVISAKIISSKITTAGVVESVVLDRNTTDADHQFVPKLIKEVNGTPVSSSTIITDKVAEVSSKITNAFPTEVSTPVSDTLGTLDTFRDQTLTQINAGKDATNKQIALLGNSSSSSKVKPSGIDGTEKPIALIKLFFLSVLGFIFGNKIVFYGILAFLLFILIRFIYRKIRNR